MINPLMCAPATQSGRVQPPGAGVLTKPSPTHCASPGTRALSVVWQTRGLGQRPSILGGRRGVCRSQAAIVACRRAIGIHSHSRLAGEENPARPRASPGRYFFVSAPTGPQMQRQLLEEQGAARVKAVATPLVTSLSQVLVTSLSQATPCAPVTCWREWSPKDY